LASALQSAEYADANIVVLADGPIPEDLRALASKKARIVDLAGGPVGMRRSFMAGLKYPDVAEWPDEDLVYFCEDDYLHETQAMVELTAAAVRLDSAHYFALYAWTQRHHPCHSPCAPYRAPAMWQPHAEYTVGETLWVNVPNTTSTFGARIGTLREDIGIFRQGMIPYRTRLLDYEMLLVVQGRFPYSPSEILRGHEFTRSRTGLKALAANAVLTPFRLAYELRTLTRRRNPHLLYAPDPNLACHMETEFLSPGVDWSAVAKCADIWADGQ
jgi:hypothetical protein